MNLTKRLWRNALLWRYSGWSILAVIAGVGTIGVLDRLYEGEYIEKEEYVNCLKALLENNGQKVRLPEKELLKRVDNVDNH